MTKTRMEKIMETAVATLVLGIAMPLTMLYSTPTSTTSETGKPSIHRVYSYGHSSECASMEVKYSSGGKLKVGYLPETYCGPQPVYVSEAVTTTTQTFKPFPVFGKLRSTKTVSTTLSDVTEKIIGGVFEDKLLNKK